MTDNLSSLVLRAVGDHSTWTDVLRATMAACGATIGVVSLREIETGELSFPEESSATLEAPLIVGIGPDFVASYFDRYYAIDPWTEIESKVHPHSPYFMSEHLAIEDLKRTEFFRNWLEPQGVSECLVAEIVLSKRHWVALNLLFDETAVPRKAAILAQLEAFLPIIRRGWALSERLVSLSYSQTASLGYLERWPAPCLILNEDLVVTAANSSGLREFSEHVPLSRSVSIDAQLELLPCPLKDALEAFDQRAMSPPDRDSSLRVASARPGYSLHVSAVAIGEDIVGKRRAQLLVIAKPDAPPVEVPVRTPRIWESPELTKAQAAIVRWIAEGGLVPEFALQNNITKKTAYDHLFAARQKLDGMSARDIYTSHQSLLMMER